MEKTSKYPIKDERGLLNSKQTWTNLIKGNKIRLIFVFVFILVFLFFLSFIITQGINFLINNFSDVFMRNFGKSLTSQLSSALTFSIFITMFILIFSKIFLSIFYGNQGKNNWFLLTISLVTFVMIFGFFALDYSMGNKGLYLNLFDAENNISGTIKCEGTQGPIIIRDKIICKTNLNKKEQFILEKEEIVLVLTLNLDNGEKKDVISYFALANSTYLMLNVYETYLNGTGAYFSVGYPHKFMTQDEFQKNRERFIQVFLALMAVAFITVPIAMINFRNLWRLRLRT